MLHELTQMGMPFALVLVVLIGGAWINIGIRLADAHDRRVEAQRKTED